MATGGEEKVGYSLVGVGTVTLENTDKDPWYISIVVCQDKIVVLDDKTYKVNIHGLHDGKFLASSDSLELGPRDMCLMDAMTICVIHRDGLIKMMSIDSTDMSRVIKTTKTLSLQGVLLDEYHGVVRFNDNLVVTGVKQRMMYWCIVSLQDGHVDTIHQICKGDRWCRVTTKDNIIYISCDAGDESPDTGVYGFDILNPGQCKYKYKHQRLQDPSSIVINEDGNIFVCDYVYPDTCIHQLTASCQLVAIFTWRQGIPLNLYALVGDNGRLYGTRFRSNDITVFRPVYQGTQKDSEVETSIEIEQGNVDKRESSVKTEWPPSGPSLEDSKDKEQDHNASEVQMCDERKPVIDEIPTKIVQDIRIQQIVAESLNQAGFKVATEEMDLFLKFQREIGTTVHFSKDPQTLIDGQESLKATEMFFQESHPDMKNKWLEYKNQGKLTPELIDVIYARDRNPELHDKKDAILGQMEKLNVIVKARSFHENGVKVENYFFTPCILSQESSRDIIQPEPDLRMVSTSSLCYFFTGKILPPTIFDRLLAACLTRWPVAKNKETSDNLLFRGCAVFDLDLFHRMTLHCKDNVVLVRIIRMVINDLNIPDAKLCTRVRKFITLNLSKITSCLDQNLPYEIRVHCQESHDVPENRFHFSPPFEMWLADEVHDPDAPITREHMNHARLCVGLVTVCGNGMREILLTQVPAPHTNIYQAILASKTNLTKRQGRPLLNQDQSQVVFPDPKGRYMATVEQFDLSLLYTLIRNVSTVPVPSMGWGNDPQDQPRDRSLGASVERIRSYRNHIIGHSSTMEISQSDFDDYWNKFDNVLQDIEYKLGTQGYRVQLEKQKRQVISVYEAC